MDERDFISNRVKQDPKPLIYWGLFLLLIVVGIYSVRKWESEFHKAQREKFAELQVTNREFQLFLWQHPQYMRLHSKKKSGYLPAFSPLGRGELDPEMADLAVHAPPDLLFRYHRWDELIGDLVFPRKVSDQEWERFFADNPVWMEIDDSRRLMQTYVGWRNYYEEGEAINLLPLTYEEVRAFVERYPGYAPEKWSDLEPDYRLEGSGEIPSGTLPSFVRVALYNMRKVKSE